jgi:inner membrane protein
MASLFTHAFAAVSIGKTVTSGNMPRRFWLWSILCSLIPDADVIGFAFGISYGSVLGHRGFSHSLLFAAVMGLAAAKFGCADASPDRKKRFWMWLYFSALTASHGVLDAMTNGGLGVAFFSPFDATRYFFPWQPLGVSPIGIRPFFSDWGMRVMMSEFVYVWIPLCVLFACRGAARRLIDLLGK